MRLGWIIYGLTVVSWLTAPTALAGRAFPCRAEGGTPAAWERWADAAERSGWGWDVHCDDPADEACQQWAKAVRRDDDERKKRRKDKKRRDDDSDSRDDDSGSRDDGDDGDDDDDEQRRTGDDDEEDDDGGGDDEHTGTQNGQMTYYWASEPDIGYGSGNLGACDNQLVAFQSVAVPKARWGELKGRVVSIEGVCERCVVDDMCAGPGCKDLDLYVGTDNSEGYDGIESVRFRVGKQVPGHPCL